MITFCINVGLIADVLIIVCRQNRQKIENCRVSRFSSDIHVYTAHLSLTFYVSQLGTLNMILDSVLESFAIQLHSLILLLFYYTARHTACIWSGALQAWQITPGNFWVLKDKENIRQHKKSNRHREADRSKDHRRKTDGAKRCLNNTQLKHRVCRIVSDFVNNATMAEVNVLKSRSQSFLLCYEKFISCLFLFVYIIHFTPIGENSLIGCNHNNEMPNILTPCGMVNLLPVAAQTTLLLITG